MKIRLVRAELFYADSRTDGRTDAKTDMMKLIDAFRNFTNTPKRVSFQVLAVVTIKHNVF
jgi:hypothetical protein